MFPIFETARFRLREIQQADIEVVYLALSDPRVIAHYGVSCDSLEATQLQMDWFRELHEQQEGLWWGICRPEAPHSLLGACGFNDWERAHRRVELGYWLLPDHWGQGIIAECLVPVIVHAFTRMAVHRVEAVVEPDNRASARVLEKLGFVHEGTRRDCEFKAGGFLSLECYGLLSTDWRR
ncbi:MAG: GNAT family protein [Pseudomonas sp.]|uniref:GNAT family N-acetyltransferase n=1 Tax=Pseudomonas sp. TaxID=306 RepID=UPI0033994175